MILKCKSLSLGINVSYNFYLTWQCRYKKEIELDIGGA